MPIRFRCQYCNQLLGIARRKAGTAVQCPTCHGQVIVPPGGLEDPAPSPPLFERSEFEVAFQMPALEAPPGGAAPPGPQPFPFQPATVPSAFDVERVQGPTALAEHRHASAAGLLLSPTQATFLTVAAVL